MLGVQTEKESRLKLDWGQPSIQLNTQRKHRPPFHPRRKLPRTFLLCHIRSIQREPSSSRQSQLSLAVVRQVWDLLYSQIWKSFTLAPVADNLGTATPGVGPDTAQCQNEDWEQCYLQHHSKQVSSSSMDHKSSQKSGPLNWSRSPASAAMKGRSGLILNNNLIPFGWQFVQIEKRMRMFNLNS